MSQSSRSITIDKWIDEAKHYVCPPVGDAYVPHRSLDYLLWQDNVECILNVRQKQMPIQGLFDPKEFKLTLRLCVPPSSGFLVYYRHSPIVVIDEYTGEEDDADAPEWLRAHPSQLERKFWQQRSLMLDLMLYFVADLPENARLSSKVEAWCKAISVPASGMTTSIHPRVDVKHVSPYNTRGRKRRASELSTEESQRVRKALNAESSPLRRRK